MFTANPALLAKIKRLLPGALVVGRLEKGAGTEIENFNGKVGSFEHF